MATPPEEETSLGMEGAYAETCPDFSTKQFSKQPSYRFGDLFPLPVSTDEGYAGDLNLLGSRRSRQRVHKRRTLVDRECGSIWALNSLAGFSDTSSWPSRPLNSAQRRALQHIRRAHRERPAPPACESPQAALRQLLCKKAGTSYSGDQPGQLAPYDRSKLSLPRGQQNPSNLASILPPAERHRLENFESEMLLSSEEVASVLEVGLEGECYVDPVLKNNSKEYHEFISDLIDCNLLYFTDKPRVQVGVFCVTKKQRQRLIIDARRANRLFRTPPSTCLGSVESWTRLEVEGGGPLFMAQEDVKDYFYRLGISKELGEYFSLPAIDPAVLQAVRGELPQPLMDLLDASGAPVHPCLRVLPMGFAWAFHLAHEAHVEVARRALCETPVVRDRRPPPRLGGEAPSHQSGMLIYADNCNHLGVCSARVDSDQQRVREALHGHGLDTHDVIHSCQIVESLGVRVDGLCGKVQATPHRDWRLDRALQACQAAPALSGEELEVLIGHMTSRALLHRGLMGVLRHSYVFVRTHYGQRRRLWPSVLHELELFRCLMPLGQADLFAEWDGQSLCTDACPSGYAVCESDWSAEDAAKVGREDERWRFYRGPADRPAPRAAALDTSLVFEDPLTVRPEVDGELFGDLREDPSFPEVPLEMMEIDRWHVLWGTPVRWHDAIHVLEARSVLGAVKHRCRDSQRHGKRITVLNDNLGVVLAVQKGRCSNYGILRIIRRIAAHCLATGIRLHLRWVPSEYNVADKPSRQWEHASLTPLSAGKGEAHHRGQKEGDREAHQIGGREIKCQDEESYGRGRGPEEGSISKPVPDPIERNPASAKSRFEENVGGQSRSEKGSTGKAEEIRSKAAGNSGREVDSGSPQRDRADKEGLLAEARKVLRLRPVLSTRHHEGGRAGRGLVRLHRPLVPEWRKLHFGAQTASVARAHAAGDSQGRDPIATFQASSERLAAHGTYPDPTADARDDQECHLRDFPGARARGASHLQRDQLLHLREAGRAHEDEGRGLRREESGVQLLCASGRADRARGGVQGGYLRRGPDPGRPEGAMAQCSAERSRQAEAKNSWAGGKSVELHGQAVPSSVAAGGRHPECERGCKKPVPKQARGGKPGPPSEAPICAVHTAQREVGVGQQCPHIRQARTTPAGPEQAREPATQFWRIGTPEFRDLAPQWFGTDATRSEKANDGRFKGKAFLSLFGGVAEAARLFSKEGGVAAVVDTTHSSRNDLSKMSSWNAVLKVVNYFDAVGIDLPCNTWSRARRAPKHSRLPGPLRGDSDNDIMGLPELSEKRLFQGSRRQSHALWGLQNHSSLYP